MITTRNTTSAIRPSEDELFRDTRNELLRVSETDKGKLVDFFLTESIESINDYVDFLREVSSARPDDVIRVHINCYGGDVNVAMNIFDALVLTDAYVEVCLEGVCASAASMIMLAAQNWKVFPHSYVMIHAWTSVQFGKWNELQEQFHYEKRVWENQFREIYKNFLTPEEIEQCLNGKDFWFSADEVVKRLNDFQADSIAKQEAVNGIIEKYQKIMNDEFKKIEESEEPSASKAKPSANKKKPATVKPLKEPASKKTPKEKKAK
jgi:ATP-dependent protease ClpP protease subunit